jgi:RNA polymerase sigma factor (sigma-70 family)
MRVVIPRLGKLRRQVSNEELLQHLPLALQVGERFHLRMCHQQRRSDRSEVLHQAQIGLWLALASFDETFGQSFDSWASFEIFWFLRDVQRQRGQVASEMNGCDLLLETMEDPMEEPADPDMPTREELMADLQPLARLVVRLHVDEHYLFHEIGTLLGLNYKTVSAIYRKALHKVLARLEH